MRKMVLLSAVVALMAASQAPAVENPVIGIVNFSNCITDSKVGKKEQESMESLRKQIASMIEETEKELKELADKFEDTEYLDSLSPKAEEELKAKYQTRQEDMARYQNQFYQVLNQAHYQMIQKMSQNVAKAAESIAQEKKLDYVMNKEACFYVRPDLDVTSNVIAEMDKSFELDAKAKNVSENDSQINAVEETLLDQAG
jgi:outer membrane protein